jgi:hypothetical protein
MNAPQFRAHIEKRPVGRRHRWYCITREISDYSDGYAYFGPLRSKREAKLVKDSAKRGYAETRRGF